MKYLLIFSCVIFYACAAVPIKTKAPAANVESNFITTKGMDKTWDGILQFIFRNKYNIKSQFKDQTSSSIRVEIVNAPISYFDDKKKAVADSTAIALTDIRKRINNNTYVLAVAGTMECVFLLNKLSDGTVFVSVNMDKTCKITEFFENNVLEKRRIIPNVEIHSTGRIEEKLRLFLSNQN